MKSTNNITQKILKRLKFKKNKDCKCKYFMNTFTIDNIPIIIYITKNYWKYNKHLYKWSLNIENATTGEQIFKYISTVDELYNLLKLFNIKNMNLDLYESNS